MRHENAIESVEVSQAGADAFGIPLAVELIEDVGPLRDDPSLMREARGLQW